MDWKTINIAPEIVARYLAKGKTPPSKPKQKWVTRYHRTKTENAPSIEQSGLLVNNPNIGDNTYLPNKADYHKIWLADNPREIPVLRNMMSTAPQDVTTYKVRMPKEWYMESPRFYMPKGRGRDIMKRTPADEIRLTDEGNYKIDLLGRDIPPQYLQKLPVYKTDESISDTRADSYLSLFDYGVSDFNLTDPKDVQKLPKRLRAEAKVLSKDLADNGYHYLADGLTPSDELVAATVSPVKVARSVINKALHDDAEFLAKRGYPDINDTYDWTKLGIGHNLDHGLYRLDPLDTGLPIMPELMARANKYLTDFVENTIHEDADIVTGWLMMSPKDLAESWIDSKLPAIKNKNTLTDKDILPVFSQIKHKLMVPDDRYTDWKYSSYDAYSPTDDIDLKAAATLLEALQRSDRKDLVPQAREILFNNLKYYK